MTVKTLILEYLRGRDYTPAGLIEDYIRTVDHSKASTSSRRCREMVEDGKLEADYRQINGKGPHFVCYRRKLQDNLL
jgi:hypothetical protein